jgi:putative transposase
MEQPPFHRKKIRHFDQPNHFHALTFSCFRRLPLLSDHGRLPMLSESIDRAMKGHGYALTAFVYMPEHVHLLVFPGAGASGIADLLKAIKRPFSYRFKRSLLESASPLLGQLTVQQRPGVTAFRFWQEGPGYDRNLVTMESAQSAANYIHLNPVRRGLVESELDWFWSSARYYEDERAEIETGLPAVSRLGEQPFA